MRIYFIIHNILNGGRDAIFEYNIFGGEIRVFLNLPGEIYMVRLGEIHW